MKPLLEDLFSEPLVDEGLLCDLTYDLPEHAAEHRAVATVTPTDLLQTKVDQLQQVIGLLKDLLTTPREAALVPSVTVHAPEPAQQTINVYLPEMQPTFQPPANHITVQAATPPAPVIHVATPVEVQVPKQAAPVIHVATPAVTVNVPEPKATRKRVERDEAGKIIGIVEEA